MVRAGLSILAALALAFTGVVLVEMFSAVVHPFPEGFTGEHDEICQHVAKYPHWVLGVAAAAWLGIIFVSILVARWIGNVISACVIGGLLLAALTFNVVCLPYPMWFKVVMLGGFPLMAWTGLRTGTPAVRIEEIVARVA